MKIKNILLKRLFFITFITILVIISSNNIFLGAYTLENTDESSKIYCNVSIEENFDDNCVIVVINKETSEINKVYEKSFFGDIDIKNIYDLTYINSEMSNDININVQEFNQILKIELNEQSKQNVIDVIHQLETIDELLWAGPNYYKYIMEQPPAAQEPINGSHYYPYLWGLNGDFGIDAEEAWDFTTGNSNIRVGVIDTGMYAHPDILANMSTDGGDFVNMLDEDENIPGPLRDDPDDHGTHVSGIIGATGTNSNGVVGVAWNVELVPLQVVKNESFDGEWFLDSEAVIRAFTWAANNGIDIINYSAGSYYDDVAQRNAMGNFQGLIVAAAGNDNLNTDLSENAHYPSNYSKGYGFSDRVISVGAYEQKINEGINTIEKCNFSNYGFETVSIFAPGKRIISTTSPDINNNSYMTKQGTSMAAPYVTGVAVLLWDIIEKSNMNMSRDDIARYIKEIIMSSAITDDPGKPLDGLCVSNGRLNAYEAIKYVLSNRMNTIYYLNNDTEINTNLVVSSTDSFFDEINGFYELTANSYGRYDFTISATAPIEVFLYDENFNEIIYNDTDPSFNKIQFEKEVIQEKIYLRTKFINEDSTGTINTKISVDQTSSVIIGNNNVLLDYIYGVEDYVFNNNLSGSFYKITLNATNSSGTIEYPEGCIKVYEDETKQQLLTRLETIYYTLDAETDSDSNNLVVFLEYGQSYYINIDLPDYSYSSMNIDIERLSNTYNIVTYNNAEEHVILEENTTAYGDFIQRVEILEAGRYTITFIHDGPQSEGNLSGQQEPNYLYYVFYKEVSSPAEQYGDLELVIPHMATTVGNTVEFTYNLQPGVYYIGYHNKLNNEPISISISCE